MLPFLYKSFIDMVGMPIQTTSDCGSEMTEIYGRASVCGSLACSQLIIYNSEEFSPNFPIDEVLAHQFLRSIHNTTIEWGWFNLCIQWGDNVVVAWEEREGIYNPSNSDH